MTPRAALTKHLLDGDDSFLTGNFDKPVKPVSPDAPKPAPEPTSPDPTPPVTGSEPPSGARFDSDAT